MAKHIHVWLHGRKKTQDNAGFKEADHPRGKGGLFATSQGDANHHETKEMEHSRTARKLEADYKTDTPEYKAHLRAAENHEKAAQNIHTAESAHAAGKLAQHATHMTHAENFAKEAAKHEATLKGDGAQTPKGELEGGEGGKSNAPLHESGSEADAADLKAKMDKHGDAADEHAMHAQKKGAYHAHTPYHKSAAIAHQNAHADYQRADIAARDKRHEDSAKHRESAKKHAAKATAIEATIGKQKNQFK